jgi:SnoaL-like domain
VAETQTASLTPEATRERNVGAVRRMYQCERERDLGAWGTLWNKKARAVFPACNYLDPIVGRDALVAWTEPKFATRGNVEINEEILPLVDPTRVLARVRLSIELAAGDPPFLSEIWVMFTFDDDGLILEHAEMFDTAQYRDILMRPTTPALPVNLRPGSLPDRS